MRGPSFDTFIANLVNYFTKNKEKLGQLSAYLLVFFGSIANWFYMIFIIRPALYSADEDSAHFFISFFSTLILIGVHGHLYVSQLKDSSVKKVITKKLESEKDWTFCSICQIDVPPNSWHCKICNACILRRNHHCYYTMRCVGEFNYANFLGLLFYVILGSLMMIYLQFSYLQKLYDMSYINYFLRSSFLFGYYLIVDFSFGLILSMITMLGGAASLGAFITYFRLSMKAQTTIDYLRLKENPDESREISSFTNLGKFIGSYPLLRIILPFFDLCKFCNSQYGDKRHSMCCSSKKFN